MTPLPARCEQLANHTKHDASHSPTTTRQSRPPLAFPKSRLCRASSLLAFDLRADAETSAFVASTVIVNPGS